MRTDPFPSARLRKVWPQVERAEVLFRRLRRDGHLPDDAQLARLPEYRAFLALGMRIRAALSRDAFDDVASYLCDTQPVDRTCAERELSHLWAGLADMPVMPPRPTYHA